MTSPLGQVASEHEVAVVCNSRRGGILRHKHILKCDHFPSARNQDLEEQLDAAPNFRKVNGLPIFGCGQPTQDGYAPIVKRIIETSEDGVTRILWFNLRQEPMVYVNGRPYVLKMRATPFENLEQLGISREELDQQEARLKEEILEEASAYDGRLLLHGETMPPIAEVAARGELYSYWEPCGPNSVKTVAEVFENLGQAGVPVKLCRIPLTDEKAPEKKYFDQLLQDLRETDYETGLVFNCQLGRGRTTTGMVIACMLHDSKAEQTVPPSLHTLGDIDAVEPLLPLLAHGLHARGLVDLCIDHCSHMQNIRAAILQKKHKAESFRDEGHALLCAMPDRANTPDGVAVAELTKPRPPAPELRALFRKVASIARRTDREESVGLRYLERYVYLVFFAEYILSMRSSSRATIQARNCPFGQIAFADCFEHWVARHPRCRDLYATLDNLSLLI